MSRSHPHLNVEDGKIDLARVQGIALGETFYKAEIPWIEWSVTRINVNINPVHVELTMRKDPKTRITVSVDALMSHRYFLPCGNGNSVFPPIRHGAGAAPPKRRPRRSMSGRRRLTTAFR